jgi:hypothetical protein
MGTVLAGAGSLVSHAVLHIGSITLHDTAAYLGILAVLAVLLGLVSRH